MSKIYVICIGSDYVRDTQIYQPENGESWDTEDLNSGAFEDNWIDTDREIFIGSIAADSVEDAIEKGAREFGYDEIILSAYEATNG